MKKLLRRLVLVGVAVLTMLAASAVAAQASSSDCAPSGQRRFCVWTNGYFSGVPSYYWTVPTGSGGFCVEFGGSLNDNVDSAAISGARSATMYEHAGCSGMAVIYLAPTAFGGPWKENCWSWLDNWACAWGQPGKLPSSAWIIK